LRTEVTFTNCVNQVLQQDKGVIFFDYFSIGVVNDWNKLPDCVVAAPKFKNELDHFLMDKLILYSLNVNLIFVNDKVLQAHAFFPLTNNNNNSSQLLFRLIIKNSNGLVNNKSKPSGTQCI